MLRILLRLRRLKKLFSSPKLKFSTLSNIFRKKINSYKFLKSVRVILEKVFSSISKFKFILKSQRCHSHMDTRLRCSHFMYVVGINENSPSNLNLSQLGVKTCFLPVRGLSYVYKNAPLKTWVQSDTVPAKFHNITCTSHNGISKFKMAGLWLHRYVMTRQNLHVISPIVDHIK